MRGSYGRIVCHSRAVIVLVLDLLEVAGELLRLVRCWPSGAFLGNVAQAAVSLAACASEPRRRSRRRGSDLDIGDLQ
jgi:hypothetical protein